jgi:hypothetical protein
MLLFAPRTPYSLLFFIVDIVVVTCLGLAVVAVDLRVLLNFVLCLTAALLLVLLLFRFGRRP